MCKALDKQEFMAYFEKSRTSTISDIYPVGDFGFLTELVGQPSCWQILDLSPVRASVSSVGNSRTRRVVHHERSDCGQLSYPSQAKIDDIGDQKKMSQKQRECLLALS